MCVHVRTGTERCDPFGERKQRLHVCNETVSSQEFFEKGLPGVDRLARCVQDRIAWRGARWRRCEKQSCLFEGLPNRRHLIRFILYVVVVASRKDLCKVVMAIA